MRIVDVAVLAVAFAQVANTTGSQRTRLSLEAHILMETGVEPIDCGTHPRYKPDPDALHRSVACARNAKKDHFAFKLMQRGLGEDSEVAFGLLGLRDGATLWFWYDSGPCGGPMCNERFEAVRCLDSDSLPLVAHEADGNHRLIPCKAW
jgi:hypothetical protein